MKQFQIIAAGVVLVLGLLVFAWLRQSPAQKPADELALIRSQNLELHQQVLSQFNAFPGIAVQHLEISPDFKSIRWRGVASGTRRLNQYSPKMRLAFSQLQVQAERGPSANRFQMQAPVFPARFLNQGPSRNVWVSQKNPTPAVSIRDLLTRATAGWCEMGAIQKLPQGAYQVQMRGSLPGFLAFLRSLQLGGFKGQIQNLKMESRADADWNFFFTVPPAY